MSKSNNTKKSSAQEICDKLLSISDKKKWERKDYEDFIKLIINPEKLYKANESQKESLFRAILSCPNNYKSLLFLTLISNANQNLVYEDIAKELVSKIKEKIIKDFEDQKSIPITEIIDDSNKLFMFFDEFTKKKLNHTKKTDLCRDIISLFIPEYEKINLYTNLILSFFLHSTKLEKPIRESTEKGSGSESLLRSKIITDFFQGNKPTLKEAERLLQYNRMFEQIDTKANQLKKVCSDNTKQIEKYKQINQEQKEKLERIENELSQAKADLEKEYRFYQQLDSSSQAQIKQERNSAITEINNRIEHELKKLERCFTNLHIDLDDDSLVEKKRIGLRIIKKIKSQLSIED